MTGSVNLAPASGGTARKPGELLEMVASWSLDRQPKTIVARLCWFTRGKGTPDLSVIAEKPLGGSGLSGEAKFSFNLPAGPYSFSGQLITLTWTIEVAIDDDPLGQWSFILSPTGAELLLEATPAVQQLAAPTIGATSLR